MAPGALSLTMDALTHDAAVITHLAVTDLTQRRAYGDIFATTMPKTLAVFFVTLFHYITGVA